MNVDLSKSSCDFLVQVELRPIKPLNNIVMVWYHYKTCAFGVFILFTFLTFSNNLMGVTFNWVDLEACTLCA